MDTTLASLAIDDAAEPDASSIHRLPREVLLLILSHVESSTDLNAVFRADKAMHDLASDTVLGSQWLLNHYNAPNALALAASKGRDDIMLHMLKNEGVSATAKIPGHLRTSFTPLKLACHFDLPKVVQYLWHQRKDVSKNVRDAVEAAHVAASFGRIECLQQLLALPFPLSVDSRDAAGNTLLHSAAGSGSAEMVQLLSDYGASCTRNKRGLSALHYSCADPDSDDVLQASIVRVLLGADGVSVLDCRDEDEGCSALHLAAKGLPLCCEELIRAGCDVSACNRHGKTALDLSIETHAYKTAYGFDGARLSRVLEVLRVHE